MALTINIRANPLQATVQTAPVTLVPNENFLLRLGREVQQLPRSEQKRLKRQAIVTLTALLSTCVTHRALAASPEVQLGPEVGELFIGLMTIMVGLSVLIALITYMSAGVARMFNLEDFSEKWTRNILKGLGQALLATPIVMTLVFICHLLFGNSVWYVDPWKIVTVFLGK